MVLAPPLGAGSSPSYPQPVLLRKTEGCFYPQHRSGNETSAELFQYLPVSLFHHRYKVFAGRSLKAESQLKANGLIKEAGTPGWEQAINKITRKMQLVALSSTEQFGSDQFSLQTNTRTYYSSGGSQSRPELRAERHDTSELEGYTNWVYYHKPITVFTIGVFALLAGVVLTTLYFIRAVEVPYILGPVCLSIGLMFMVTGLVWIPIVKEKIRQNGLVRKLYARQPAA